MATRDVADSASDAGRAEASPFSTLTTSPAAAPPVPPFDVPLPLAGLALCDWPELPSGATSVDDEAADSSDALCEVNVVLGRALLGGAPQRLPPGQIVVLDSAAQAPVEIWSGGQLVARGQLRTLDGHYCVQVNELLRPPVRKRRP